MNVAAGSEYSSATDINQVLDLEARIDKLDKLGRTRDIPTARAIAKFKAKPTIISTREEAVAKFVKDYKGGLPHNWKRYPQHVRRSKRKSPPRPGSSLGEIAPTQYTGFREANKGLDNLFRSLDAIYALDSRYGAKATSPVQRQMLKQLSRSLTPEVITGK